MKGKLLLILILIIIFLGFVGFKFFVLNNENNFGKIKIISSPATSVFIDNVAIGRTPYEDKYKVGEFLVKLIPEGNSTETVPWQGKVKVYKNALTYINRELGSTDINSTGEILTMVKMDKTLKGPQYGEIYIESEPNGAIIYLDNDEKGIAPLVLADVLKGEHELSISLPGFFPRTIKINIEGGFRLNASIKLAIDQNQQQVLQKSASNSASLKEASTSAKTGPTFIVISETDTGWLRVRDDASLEASETAKVKPGEKYELLDEKEGWYKIKLDKNTQGWISSVYSEKQ